MPRRSLKGYKAQRYLKGFKAYLSVTGKQRFAFHNDSEKNPQLFEQYLPYAIAFGVEEKWAKVFSDVVIPNPSWYESDSIHRFTASAFVYDMGSLVTSFSSSTGSSGSSGGGGSW